MAEWPTFGGMFPPSFYQHLQQVNHTGMRAGTQRQHFTPIWVVQVGGRVFARSWTKSETGWYATLLQTGTGHLQYGDHIIAITARRLPPDDALHAAINEAYLTRYNSPENIPYAQGIAQADYAHYTLELEPA